MNDPGTWELLGKVTDLAKPLGITLLPEIHASYAEGTYHTIAEKGYMVYDFFLPGLLLDALERRSGEVLVQWIREICDRKMLTVNMLGCHDGIPLLDLKGLLSEERIQSLIDTVVSRGGYVKDLHGAKNVYYQVNATYYSALGEETKKCFWHGQYSFSCRANRRFGIWICLPVVMIMLPFKGRVPVGIKKSTART